MSYVFSFGVGKTFILFWKKNHFNGIRLIDTVVAEY